MFGSESPKFYGLEKRKEPEIYKSKKLRRARGREAHVWAAAAKQTQLVGGGGLLRGQLAIYTPGNTLCPFSLDP